MKGVSSLLIEEGANYKSDERNSIKHILSKEPFHLRDSAMAEVMKPLHISMTCFGLNLTRKHNSMKGIKCDCRSIHCCITVLLAWGMGLGFFVSYDKHERFEQGLFQKLFLHIFALQMAFGLTVHVYDKHKHIPVLLKLWENYKIKHGGTRLNVMKAYIKNWVIMMNAAYMVMFLFFVIYSVFNTERFIDFIQPVFWYKKYIPTENRIFLVYTMYAVTQYLIMATVQPIILAFCMNHLLKEEFAQITKEFSETMNDKIENGYASNDMNRNDSELHSNETEKYRLRHLEVCT